jgi:hypothetical protein
MQKYPYVVESTTVIKYPESKRKVILNNKNEVISDSAKDTKAKEK